VKLVLLLSPWRPINVIAELLKYPSTIYSMTLIYFFILLKENYIYDFERVKNKSIMEVSQCVIVIVVNELGLRMFVV
jgi:hypothetical protein